MSESAGPTASTQIELPPRPARSLFAIGAVAVAVALTVVSVVTVEFSLWGIVDNFGRTNPVAQGLTDIRWGEMFSARSRAAFASASSWAFCRASASAIATCAGGGPCACDIRAPPMTTAVSAIARTGVGLRFVTAGLLRE